MSKYNEIIEMEVLNGIDKAMHSLLVEYKENFSHNRLNIFNAHEIDELKRRIPEYIDKQYKTIILENLHDSVHMLPPTSE